MKFSTSFFTAVCCLFSLASLANFSTQEKPKLVVGVVVDQMRWDYLYRYYDRYSEDGFKRLLKEGFTSENTNIDYVPSVTAIGHSTLYTGSVPAIHGIAGNNFIIQATGQRMYCTEDTSVVGVGAQGSVGQQSPRNLLVSTVTDQLRLATNFQSKVIGISIKDRGGILPGGHFANAAYWLDGDSGNWITSTYYMDNLPKWVEGFNKEKNIDKYYKKGWNTLYDIDSYVLSNPDNSPYEGKFKGEDKPVFPRDLVKLKKQGGYDLIKATPFGNSLTLDFARAAIEAENLGNNPLNVTDFLAVSLSSTDYVGHQFGIESVEIEDTYLRLDQDLAAFLNYLDSTIGKGEYTLFLSADHGAAHNPGFYRDQKGNSGYFSSSATRNMLNEKLQDEFKEEKIILSITNYQVHLDNKLIQEKGLDEDAIRELIVKELKKVDGVAFVTDMDKTSVSSIPFKIKEKIINGYNLKRSGVIQFILEPQWYSARENATGTTHGTWGSYDTHIPAVFMGWGVKPGKTVRPTNMTDIAPTIAEILKIEMPNGNIGTPIYEAIK